MSSQDTQLDTQIDADINAKISSSSASSSASTNDRRDRMKRPTNGTHVPTLTYKTSWRHWFSSPSQEHAQRSVLEMVGFFPQSDGKRVAKVNKTDIGKGLYINEFSIDNIEPVPMGEAAARKLPETEALQSSEVSSSSFDSAAKSRPPTLVALHGYGAGLAFFFQNFEQWSSVPGSRVYALDMLGFGLSSRPKFSIPTKDLQKRNEEGRFQAVVETEDWFVDSLEAWRKAKQLEKFTLMGHSMGGYLAAVYAFKYPQHVEKLILVSPAGVERGYHEGLERHSFWDLVRGRDTKVAEQAKPTIDTATAPDIPEELTVSQSEIHHHESEHHIVRPPSPGPSAASVDAMVDSRSTTTREMSDWVVYLWNSHISPFSILRLSTGFGSKLVSSWSSRRFADLSQDYRERLHMYAYKTFIAKPSGEYGLSRLLAPGALAREPLVDRVASKLQCPSLWIYGDMDWMNENAGIEAVRRLRNAGVGSARDAQIRIVKGAGHHVYLDNPSDHDKLVVEFMKKKAAPLVKNQ